MMLNNCNNRSTPNYAVTSIILARVEMGYLLLIFIIVLVNDIEELKLIDTLGGRDNTEPVPELVLLQELLGQVLKVAPRKWDMRNNNDLPLTLLGDLDRVTKVTNTVVDLDPVVQELLERGYVEDLVGGGLRSIDGERLSLDLLLASSGFSSGGGHCDC